MQKKKKKSFFLKNINKNWLKKDSKQFFRQRQFALKSEIIMINLQTDYNKHLFKKKYKSQLGQMQGFNENNIQKVLERLPLNFQQQYDKFYLNPNNKKQSTLHKQKCILINTKQALGIFLQGTFMRGLMQQSEQKYYKTKSELINVLIGVCQRFRLNCKFLKQTSITFSVHQLKGKQIQWLFRDIKPSEKVQVPFLMYLIGQIYECFINNKQQKKLQTKDLKLEVLVKDYRENLCKLFYLIANGNTIPIMQLQLITQLLCGKYYSKQLSFQMIETSFRLVEAGIQQRNIFPYLYFIQNSPINAIKVLYNNPKWIFSKGITIYTWFQTQSLLSDHQKDQCTLFLLKTDLNNALKIKLLKNLDIQISSIVNNKEIQTAKISLLQHKIKPNQITMMGIELEVQDGGFLKSTTFSLNLRINGSFYKETIISSEKMPKFTNNDLITDFILFDKFIGKVYSIIISNRNELNAYEKLSISFSNYGICNEAYVWALVDSGVLKKENIVGIFNAQRSFEGILINYVGEKNLACFSGLVSRQKYNKYDYQIIDVLMPYLYMLIVNHKSSNYSNKSSFEQIFDMILKQIIKIIFSEQKQQDFIPSQDILFILYFLQLSQYSITQSTLNYLLEQVKNSSETQNIYFQLIGEFLDFPLLMHKGLNVQNYESNLQTVNPAKKTQLLFLLQSKWETKWTTQFQSFSSWWSPPFFHYQNDHQFNSNDFLHREDKQSRVQWQVRNFISNDLCKCILSPVFKRPQYSDIQRYQKEYVGKQCFLQDFMLDLGNIKKGKKSVLKKAVVSTLDRMKKKLLGSKELKTKQSLPSQKTILLTKKNSIKGQIMSECLFIDLLSVIMSTIRVSRQGFITIVSKHTAKTFDHMCVKAYGNDYFLHVTFHFREILFVRKRRFNQQSRTLEIRLKSGRIYLLHFYLDNVNQFISVLEEHVEVKKDPYSSYLESKEPFKWIDKQMSNFEYIQWLNDVAGRNFLDIAQYPILPWVFVANQQEQKQQQKIYRDLLKNMGSHGPEERIQHFMQKYSSNNEQQLFNEYHFGTHYSSSAIIFNYLIRLRPFSIGSMTLQSGKFDCADRIFGSYVGSWNNATNSPTDIRELVPEIYTLPQMFINLNNYDYGFTQDKLRIDNVQLPKWANKNPYKFVAKVRKQLESSYVSQNINNWVDLIFGYKQRGKAAIEHMNIFFPLTYEDSINLDTVQDPQERISFETQIAHFGQNPSQIIGNNPHPIRIKTKANWQERLFSDGGPGILIQRCNLEGKSKNSPQKEEKFIYRSIFQSKNSIMSIKFLDDFHFIVIRKEQYFIFRILQKKSQFISKEQEVSYELQSTQISINYQELGHYVPTTTIGNNLVALGGFFNGHVHFLFIEEYKCNQAMKFEGLNTVTAIQYSAKYQMLYLADNEGYLKVYELVFNPLGKSNSSSVKQIQFIEINSIKIHDSKVNMVCLNEKANLVATCSEDGFIKILNLYSQQLIRIYKNPDYELGSKFNGVEFCQISTSPLYSISFYSPKSKKIFSYSINGQYLASHTCVFSQKDKPQQKDKSNESHSIVKEFIYNMAVLPTSNTTERLTYLTSSKDLFILDLPFLEQKRKIKLKKDTLKISCFESCQNGKISLTGTEDGSVQIVADPACY